MRFQIACYENTNAFTREAPFPIIDKPEVLAWLKTSDLVLAARFAVEASSAEEAADVAFAIGNDPSEPADLDGHRWDHTNYRSMSSGDVVLVRTPDGPVAYACLSIGWKALPPDIVSAQALF